MEETIKEEVTKEQENKENKEELSINPERAEEESFEDYKLRQKIVNKAIKKYRNGILFFKSVLPALKVDEFGNIIRREDGTPEFIKGKVIKRTYRKKDYEQKNA